ncbi:hypothetical protein A0H81_00531 [Grifola frondosa]|uniref:Uncharacterized protein n=1 Tax=Grifola frondosa TaxID=5627 RepID=A0A1C7MQ65_GRIFR|nr:hypothetical protein A0H81_00531 [Grifola frondosa]
MDPRYRNSDPKTRRLLKVQFLVMPNGILFRGIIGAFTWSQNMCNFNLGPFSRSTTKLDSLRIVGSASQTELPRMNRLCLAILMLSLA